MAPSFVCRPRTAFRWQVGSLRCVRRHPPRLVGSWWSGREELDGVGDGGMVVFDCAVCCEAERTAIVRV